MITEAGLPEMLDEALLLTTELSTNGVLHAGTDLTLEVVADRGAITVTVTDFRPSYTRVPVPAPAVANLENVSERGRGLLLVDHFASSWGTTHETGRTGVWFRLDPDEPGNPVAKLDDDPTASRSGTAPLDAAAPSDDIHLSPAALDALVFSAPLPDGTEDLRRFADVTTRRLCGVLGAPGAVVLVDRGDGQGPQTLAAYGVAPAVESAQPAASSAAALIDSAGPWGLQPTTVRAVLPLRRPWRGELLLAIDGVSSYAEPLAALTAERLGLAIENERLRGADLQRQARLTFLAEASQLLAQSLNVELTMALIPQLVVPRLGRWCAVHSVDEWGELRLAAATHADESAVKLISEWLGPSGQSGGPISRLYECLRTGAPAILSAAPEGFALPLIARGQRLGTLTVGRHADRRQDAEELAIIEDLARRAALALDNARIHEERGRIARTLQQSLLPPTLPQVEQIAFGAEYVPTAGDADVGGDFYDLLPMPDRRWLVVIGDVSGKGVQAATVTGLVRDVIRVLVRDGKPLPDVLVRLNETLLERGNGRYCTLALAIVGPEGDSLDVELFLAGHERPVLLHAGGDTTLVGACGTALGLLETIRATNTQLSLAPGDALVFFTDGVTERRRGEELFGIDRLRQAAAALAGLPADVVAARLRATTLAFSTETPRDDIAILALRNESALA